MNYSWALGLLLAGVSSQAVAADVEWPKMIQGGDVPECSDIFAALKEKGSAETLLDSLRVLTKNASDEWEAESSFVTIIPKDNERPPRNIYWQTKAVDGVRFVIDEESFAWRGDQYTVFALKDGISPDQFRAGYKKGGKMAGVSTVVEQGWYQPDLIKQKNGEGLFFVNRGAQADFLGSWRFYAAGPDGIKQRCLIKFKPDVVSVKSLLPQPVATLYSLIDQTYGSGQKDGTLQTTAQIRINNNQNWASAALYPKDFVDGVDKDMDEARQKADDALQVWAKRKPGNAKVYAKIQEAYPVAEKALVAYYQESFKMTEEDATAKAHKALVKAYVLSFHFSE